MPANLDNKNTVKFEMSHSINDKSFIKQTDFVTVVELIDKLKNELNNVFMTELGEICLSENYIGDSNSEDDTEAGQFSDTTFVFVGGSHAARLAAAATDSGLEIVNLSIPGFRVTKSAVDDLAPKIQNCIRLATKRVVIIYHIYDNSVFLQLKTTAPGPCLCGTRLMASTTCQGTWWLQTTLS
jgi:hypothetical protein